MKVTTQQNFSDQVVVFDGDFLEYRKTVLKEHVKNLGARVSTKVSSKTTLIVVPLIAYGSANVTKALELGTDKIEESEFYLRYGRPVGKWLHRPKVKTSVQTLNEVVVLDVETTGLYSNSDRIVTIAMWKGNLVSDVRKKKLFSKPVVTGGKWLSLKVNPGVRIPKEATRVHGITNRMAEQWQPIRHHLSEIVNFIGSLPVVAHNAEFDFDFVNAELTRNGHVELRNQAYCTMKKMRSISGYGRASLDASLEYYRLPRRSGRSHGAKEDVGLTVLLASHIKRLARR